MFKATLIRTAFFMLFCSSLVHAATITGNGVLVGTPGDDVIIGGSGSDTLTGGRGNDRLEGGSGSDTYVFNLGDGQDVIRDHDGGYSGTDRVEMGPDVTREMVRLGNDGLLSNNADLVILVGNNGDRITIQNYYSSTSYKIEAIVIAGTTYTMGALHSNEWEYTQGATNAGDILYGTNEHNWIDGLAGNDTLYGKSGNDYLKGGAGDDILYGEIGDDKLEGGSGNDRMEGGSGSDTYVFNLGDGQDVIRDHDGGYSGTDRVEMGDGISVNDLQWSRSGNDLVMLVGTNDDQIAFLNHYSSSSYLIEQIQVLGQVYSWTELTTAKTRNALNITRIATSNDNGLLFIDVDFNLAINPASFTTDDIKLVDQLGQQYSILSVQSITDKRYRITSTLIIDDQYTVTVGPNISAQSGQLLDQNNNGITGESSDAVTKSFLLDQTMPAPTVLNSYPSTVNTPTYTFRGSKETGSKVLVNGAAVIGASTATTWAYVATLEDGANEYNFVVEDAKGNKSTAVSATITYQNTIPGRVIFSVDPNGNGQELVLSWPNYDEVANGYDIKHYKIYVSNNSFSTTSGLTANPIVTKGTKTVRLSNLIRNQTYYLAVVAEDTSGQALETVTSIAATPLDTRAPEEITNLQVVPGLTQLSLRWTPSVDTSSDLVSYIISYLDGGQTKTITLSKADIGSANPFVYSINNLQPAAAHNIRISVIDQTGNTSTGVTNPAITLLPNPVNVVAEAEVASAKVSWTPVPASAYSLMKHYAVYVEAAPFNSVAGKTPKKIVAKGAASQTSLNTTVTGLVNGTTVYVAVTAVNNSDNELKDVVAVSVTPQNDIDNPTITSAEYLSSASPQPLSGTPVLVQSGKFAIKATDKSKISRVIFTLNNEPLGNVLITNTQGAYEQAIDLLALADGNYTLGVKVYDMFENVTEVNYPFAVDLSAPAVPTISTPAQNSTLNQMSVQLTGKSAADTEIIISVNAADRAETIAVDSNGNYSTTIDLIEGLNKVAVKARYNGRAKWSAYSAEHNITVNTQIPDAPKSVSATVAKQGQVYLQWAAVASNNANNQVKGYKIYRATTSFANKNDAGVAPINNGQLITAVNFTDTLALDGNYFYAVSAFNQANNEGALSHVVSATTDSIGPKISQLTFTPEGEFDAANAIYGRGRVLVSATFSEPLRNAPYFAVVPEAGLPISIDLAKSYSDELVYTGQFTIDQSTATGTAYAAMSAFDNPGNRGTDIQQNGSLKIDTKGPDIAQLSITPSAPLKIDAANGLHVNVSIRLSEETKAGTQVKLVPMIDGVPLTGYGQGITLVAGADNLNLVGEFNLPNTVAQSSSAQLSFAHAAVDGLNNPSQTIIGQNQFQVYQGNLPPLNTPGDLTSTALPGGKIKLTWRAVEKAAGYVLYRQGPNDSALIALPPLTAIEYEDQTVEDGTYLYAIASVRRDNGQES
ncbi:MAG TPA: calcium-binding protein, partial [Cellvibrio sp.]